MRNSRSWLEVAFALTLAVGTLSRSDEVQGKARRKREKSSEKRPAAPATELAPEALGKLRAALLGSDDDAVIELVSALGASGTPASAAPLIELLAVGARPKVAAAALQSLRRLASPASTEIVILYCGNRNPEVRKSAIEALSVSKDARVPDVLLARLGDANDGVVAAAVEALVARHRAEAAPRLVELVKLQVPGMAAPLGQLAPVSMVPALEALRGSVSDADLATTLGEVLKRTDVPEPTRVELVKSLAEIPGPDATTALAEYVGGLPPAGAARPSKTAAEKQLAERAKAQ